MIRRTRQAVNFSLSHSNYKIKIYLMVCFVSVMCDEVMC
jgi:hypothetical protein